MKKIAIVIACLAVCQAHAQYRIVQGKIYSLGDNRAGWVTFTDPLRVRGFDGNNVICQSYTTTDVSGASYWVANHQYTPTTPQTIWGQKIVLENYPYANTLALGSDISGSVTAMRVSDADVTSAQRAGWNSSYQDNMGYAARARGSYGAQESVLVYDMGIPYTPPVRPLTPAEMLAADRAKLVRDKKTFNWIYKQATNGSVSAQCDLGEHYLNGKGCETNRELAVHWLSLSSDGGSIEASNTLFKIQNPQTNSVADSP